MRTLLLLALGLITLPAFSQEPVPILPYLSVRGAGAPAISPDGKWILYTSSVSGTAQIWRIPAKATPDGDCYWPEQLTFFTEPVSGTHFSPDGKWIGFRMDEGGNEKGYRVSASYVDQFANDTFGLAIGVARLNSPFQEQHYKSWWWANTYGYLSFRTRSRPRARRASNTPS